MQGDIELARGVARNDDACVAAFFQAYHAGVYRYMLCLTNNVEDAEDLAQDSLATPEATKSIGGVMTSLFGVIVYPSNGEGLHVEVISRGGVLPDKASGYELQVVGGPLLSIKDDSPLGSVRAGEQWIGGVKYIRSQSRDLLSRAPSRITVRVPVWRSGSDPKRARLFVGFVTYTTSRIFYCLNDTDINRYGVAIYPRR